MSDWKRIRKQTRRQVRGGLAQARRYAQRLDEQTEPQRRRLGAEARRRAPGFAAFAIATAIELMRQRRGPEKRPRPAVRFGQTVVLLGIAAFLAALLLKPKR